MNWTKMFSRATVDRAIELVSPQKDPAVTGTSPVWPKVIADAKRMFRGAIWPFIASCMYARDDYGRAKYGVALTHDNGRDHLRDALQEAFDGCAYLKAEVENGDPTGEATRMYEAQLVHLADIRLVIAKRDGEL